MLYVCLKTEVETFEVKKEVELVVKMEVWKEVPPKVIVTLMLNLGDVV